MIESDKKDTSKSSDINTELLALSPVNSNISTNISENERIEKVSYDIEMEKNKISGISSEGISNDLEISKISKNSKISPCPHRERVGSISEAPDFLKDNEYIHHGYRINFNSHTKVLRSLFVLHNESVNVWSHLLGVLMVLLLAIYTAFYVQAHKAELLQSLNLNLTELNQEIKHVTDPVLNYLPNMGNFTESLLDKTHEYVNIVDQKVGFYQKYVKCKECFDEIVETLSKVKNNLSMYKDKLVDNSRNILVKIEEETHVGNFIEEKMKILKEKISELIDHSHIRDAPWSDIYAFDMGDKGNKLPRWPVFVFLVSAVICLGSSAVFHWFCAHSRAMHEILNRLDYAGISILIAGSCYPPYFYFFHCEPCKYYIKLFSKFIFL
jgi:adiponectin receptor